MPYLAQKMATIADRRGLALWSITRVRMSALGSLPDIVSRWGEVRLTSDGRHQRTIAGSPLWAEFC